MISILITEYRWPHFRRTVLAHTKPSVVVAGILQLLSLLCLNSCVDSQRMQRIHSSIVDCTNNPCRTNDVPMDAVVFTVLVQEIFLWIWWAVSVSRSFVPGPITAQ